jgi:hypothetical protein
MPLKRSVLIETCFEPFVDAFGTAGRTSNDTPGSYTILKG